LEDELKFNLDSKCEVYCSCPAFHFFVSHPDLKSDNFYGTPDPTSFIPNTVRNPDKIPSICKHLARYTEYLVESGQILLR